MTSSSSKSAASPTALVVISDLEFGGAQRQVVELANSMEQSRYNLHVVALHDYVPLAKTLKDADRRLHIVERRGKFDFTVVPRLAKLIRKLKVEVVHGYLFDAEIATRLAGRMTGCAVIGSERNTDYELKPINLCAYRSTRWCHDLTIANSSAGADFNSKILGQPRTSYRVVHNGVDTKRFRPDVKSEVRQELGIRPDELIVGMFASFKPQKNHPLLLRAAKHIVARQPNTRFLLVGDELFMGGSGSVEYKQNVQKLVTELGLEKHCIFAGNRKDVEHCYRACDLTVLPSLFEGTPNVALESMASGIPVVATNVSDNAYVIPDGRVGFVVPLDEKELAEKTCRLLADATLRTRMGEAARAWVLEEFSTQRLAAKTASVYDEAISLRKKR